MTNTPLDEPRLTPPMPPARARSRVLQAVRTAPAPVGVEDVAAAVGLRLSTVRYHLAALDADGLVEWSTELLGSRGRPRRLFRPRTASGGPYQWVTLALIRTRRQGLPPEVAGRAVASPVADVVGALARDGFEPQADDGGFVLAACPLAAAVAEDAATICAVHRGFVAGLSRWDGRPTAELVVDRPGACRLILDADPHPDPAPLGRGDGGRNA